MPSKLFHAVIWSTVTGAVLMTSIAPGSACPFKKGLNSADPVTSSSPSDLTNNSLNFNQSDTRQLGIAAISLAALLGLGAGGLFLKARLAKRQTPDGAEAPQVEATETYKELPAFPIVVPAEVLNSSRVESPESETTSV